MGFHNSRTTGIRPGVSYTGVLAGKPSSSKLPDQQRAVCDRIAKEAYDEACVENGRSLVIEYNSDAEFRALKAELIRLAFPSDSPGFAPQPPAGGDAWLDVLQSTRRKIVLSNKSTIELKWNGE